MADRATVNDEDRPAGNAEFRATVKVEARAHFNAGDRALVNGEDSATVKVEGRVTVDAEARATVNQGACSTVNAGDCATVNAEDRATDVNTEARSIVSARDRARVNVEACATTIKANDCALVNFEAWATAVKAEEHATVTAKDRAIVNVQDRATVKAEDRPTVNTKSRATTVNTEARSAVKTEARATVDTEDQATVNAEYLAAVKLEAHAIVEAEDFSAVNAEDRSALNTESCIAVNVGAGATAKAEHLATVSPNKCTSVNTAAHATVKADGRLAFNAGDRVVNVENRATASAEVFATVNAEDCATVNAGDGSNNAEVDLPRSRALFDDLDCIRTERRKYPRPLATMDPENETLEIARRDSRSLARLSWGMQWPQGLRRLKTLPDDHAAELKQRLSEEVGSIKKELDICQTSLVNGVGAGGEGAAVPKRQEELLARKEELHALARMDPQEMLKEVGKRNRAKRMATRGLYQHPRRVPYLARLPRRMQWPQGLRRLKTLPDDHAAELKQRLSEEVDSIKKELDICQTSLVNGVGAGGEGAAVPKRQEELLARKEELHALARMDPREMLKEVGKRNRAKRMATRGLRQHPRRVPYHFSDIGTATSNRGHRIAVRVVLQRQSRGLADDLHKVKTDLQAAIDGTHTAGGLVTVEGFREELRATEELARLLAGMGPQKRARELATRRRARRVVASAIQRHRRRTLGRARHATVFLQEWNRRCAIAAEARSSGREAADARQEELEATREQDHTRALVEVGYPREIEREAFMRDEEARVEIRVDQVKGKLQTREHALRGGIGAGEVELQTGGVARMDGIGFDEADGKKAVVEGMGSGGLLFVEAKQEELRAKSVVEALERGTLDAVEVKRKADLVRDHRAEKAQRRADKLERRVSRDARRAKKLQDRESRAKRKAERLKPPVEVKERPVRMEREAVAEEGEGLLAQQGVQGGVHAAAGPLAGVGELPTSACSAGSLLPGSESFVRAGLGGAGLSSQQTTTGFQALEISYPGTASGKKPAKEASVHTEKTSFEGEAKAKP